MSGQTEWRDLGPKLKTTAVGYGGGALSGEGGGYGFGDVSDAQAMEALEAAYQMGIRLFDTAPIYGFGLSEQRLGDFFRNNRGLRNHCQVVTKLGVDWDADQKVRIDNSKETVKRMLSQSLDRLRLDSVDVYMIHWPDQSTPIQETMEALVELQQEGLFVSIGVSNFSPEQIREAEQVSPVDVVQAHFSVLCGSAREELLPFCREDGRGFMSYGTLAKGILSGTVDSFREFGPKDVRNQKIKAQYLALKPHVDAFQAIARRLGVTGSQLAAAWVLKNSGVSTALCGSKSLSQVHEIVHATEVDLDEVTFAQLNELSQLATPFFHGVS